MQRIYSAKLLFESISTPSSIPDKIFEERIVLVKAKNRRKVKEKVEQGFPELRVLTLRLLPAEQLNHMD